MKWQNWTRREPYLGKKKKSLILTTVVIAFQHGSFGEPPLEKVWNH